MAGVHPEHDDSDERERDIRGDARVMANVSGKGLPLKSGWLLKRRGRRGGDTMRYRNSSKLDVANRDESRIWTDFLWVGRGGDAAPLPFLGLLFAPGGTPPTDRIRDVIMSDGIIAFRR